MRISQNNSYPELIPKFQYLYPKGTVLKEYSSYLFKRIKNLRNKYQLHSQYKPTDPKTDDWIQLTLFD